MNPPADRLAGEQRIDAYAQAEHDHGENDGREKLRAEVVDDAAALEAQALQPDHHSEQQRHIERGLGERARLAIRVAGEVMAHLEHDQHDGEKMAAASISLTGALSARRRSQLPASQNDAAGTP